MDTIKTLSLDGALRENGFTDAQINVLDELLKNLTLEACENGGKVEIGTSFYIKVTLGRTGRAKMSISCKKRLLEKINYNLKTKKYELKVPVED